MVHMSESSKLNGGRVTRRGLGRVALASVAAVEAAQSLRAQQQQQRYPSALDGLEDKVDMSAFDPVLYTRKLHDAAPLRMTFRAKTRAEADRWQKDLRAKLLELMGAFPAKRIPLQPQTLEVREFPDYRREKFVFQSAPGSAVLGYLLTPKTGKAVYPAVISIPGHGRGVDDIVGIDPQGRDRTVKVDYEYDYAVQIAEQGMAAVAIEPMAFGCRRDAATKAKGATATGCQPTAGAALLLGQTMIGWRSWDVMRAIDWIETRPELDAKRVGCMGISGGGTVTLFVSAVEPRIRAAFASCSLNTFLDSIMSISHCIDNYVPGILSWAEMYDVAGLIAPRPFFAESGEKDAIFPIAASRASFERVKKVYEVFGAADLTEQETFDGPHSFWGKRGLPFLAKHLA
jgi:dienelactone hydrolase